MNDVQSIAGSGGRILAALALLVVSTAAASAEGPPTTAITIPIAPAEAIALAERVADHQLRVIEAGPTASNLATASFKETGWEQAALLVGLRDLADRSANPKYKAAILARGQATQWQLGKRAYHADDHAIGQAYLWAASHGAGTAAIAPLQASFDRILASPPTHVGLQHGERGDPSVPDCKPRWCWSDALFMAPPVWIELSRLTGDSRYADYAKAEFAATTAYLFDPAEHLYYRDSRFFDRRGPSGEKVFWSRGNGWVHAGLARIIPLLSSDDPDRRKLEGLFKQMSSRLIQLQKADGYWSPSLLADPATTRPESSGTAFFTYGLAWGIKAGLLDRATYEPAVRKGWAALVRTVQPDGLFGYVQPIGDRPDSVGAGDTHFYGGGAFLLAATAVADLKLAPGKNLTMQSATPLPQVVLNVRADGKPGERQYMRKNRWVVPADHKIGDGLIAFEGLGWESEVAAYRLYLDERMAIDIFGKKLPGNVLHTVGLGADNYHRMAAWGMDIFKVGETVGLGGIGRLREGRAVQLGRSTISLAVDNTRVQEASAEVVNAGLDGGAGELTSRLTIRAGSALTRVVASARGGDASAFISGLTVHPGVTVLEKAPDESGWGYIATWGRQSLAKDNLGIALFYRANSVALPAKNDGATLFVTFLDPTRISYAFGAAWEQDTQGIKTLPEFTSWLDKRRFELEAD